MPQGHSCEPMKKQIKEDDELPCCGSFIKKCSCGWKYNSTEVITKACKDNCDVCAYCGPDKCPVCGSHLHCGGCV